VAYVEEYLMTKFDQAMKESLEDTINSNLYQIKTERTFAVKGIDVEMDYSLIDKGVHISDDFISIVFDGTFHPASFDDSSITRDYSTMPYYDPLGRHLQVLFSEYSMKSILKTVVDSNLIQYNSTLSSDEIESLISDFTDPFGAQDEVLVIFKSANSTEFEPEVSIDQSKADYKF
jgi:hypothetical protein